MSMRSQALRLALVVAATWPCAPTSAWAEAHTVELARGQLNTRAIGVFTFTVTEAISASESLVISTAGSDFDTEIAIYDGLGRLVATNDNASSKNKQSLLSFGASATLPAGTYSAVLGSFNSVFGNGQITAGSSAGGGFEISIDSTVPVQTPSTASYLAKDGNILPSSITETELANGWMNAGDILRFDFVLESDILYGDWLAIYTTGVGFDSEIGLYDASGTLIATNDDVYPRNPLSRLSFGLDGDNGRSVVAGAYTLLVSGFNAIFGNGLKATTSSSWEGNFGVYVQSSQVIRVSGLTVPEPASIHLLGIGLIMLLILNGQLSCAVLRKQPACCARTAVPVAG